MKKLGILLLHFAAIAMFIMPLPSYAQDYYTSPDAGKGYWEVHTDYRTRNTVVDFFDSNRKPLYQEILSKKYVKLTKKNIRLFDQLLDQLTSRNLVSSSVKSFDLTADSRPDFRASPVTYDVQSIHKSLAQNIYVSDRGKLKIILKNPNHQQLGISLRDDEQRPLYEETPGDIPAYNRFFDISRLKAGTYHLLITCDRMKLGYRLTINAGKFVNDYNLEASQ